MIKCHAPLGLHHCRTIVSYDDSGRAYDGSDRNPGNFSAADSSLSENDDVIVETAPGDAEDEDDAGSGRFKVDAKKRTNGPDAFLGDVVLVNLHSPF